MRSVGVVCLAIGIVFLIFSVFPVVLAENAIQRGIGLGCAAFLALPLIVGGAILIRRAERALGPAATAEASETFLHHASAVLEVVGGPRAEQVRRQRSVNWKWVLAVVVLLGLAGGTVLYIDRRNQRRIDQATEAYLPVIDRALAGSRSPAQPSVGPGKVLVVDGETRRVSRLHFDLPDALLPADPADVGIVAVVVWVNAQVGMYEGNQPALQTTARVRVIDMRRNAALPEVAILGGPPPTSIPSTWKVGRGDSPYQQVIDYLVEVCR